MSGRRGQIPTQVDDNIMMLDAPATPDEPGQSSQTTNMRTIMATTVTNGTNGIASKSTAAKDDFGPPGSAWTNKKAKEEYDAAAVKLADANWHMNKYGDPLLRSDNYQ